MPQILLIDDDEVLRESVALHLHADGHEVTMARHGGIGLQMLENQDFDLIITDLVMPHVEGIEFLLAVRRKDTNIPVIVMTGDLLSAQAHVADTRADYLKMASGLGATRTLRKPFTPSQLRRMIADCLKN